MYRRIEISGFRGAGDAVLDGLGRPNIPAGKNGGPRRARRNPGALARKPHAPVTLPVRGVALGMPKHAGLSSHSDELTRCALEMGPEADIGVRHGHGGRRGVR